MSVAKTYTGQDLYERKDWYEWQTQLYDVLKQDEPYKIHWVIDEKGGTGKTRFAKYLSYRENAIPIVGFHPSKGIFRYVKEHPNRWLYIWDLPKHRDPKGLYQCLISVKRGVLPPNFCMMVPAVCVLSNRLPDYQKIDAKYVLLWEIREGKLAKIEEATRDPV
jgi:hypothetical protein